MNDGYLGNVNLKKVGVELSYTEEQVAEIFKCSQDPVYFIKNYVKIVHVDKGLVPFDMWNFQEDMVNSFKDNRFIICKMPRCGCFTNLTRHFTIDSSYVKCLVRLVKQPQRSVTCCGLFCLVRTM